MNLLTLLAVKETETQCRSIVVKDAKLKTIATIWADETFSFNGTDIYREELKFLLSISKNFITIFHNIKN